MDAFVVMAQHWCAGTAGFWDVSAVLVHITASQDASEALVHRDSAIGLAQMRAHPKENALLSPGVLCC